MSGIYSGDSESPLTGLSAENVRLITASQPRNGNFFEKLPTERGEPTSAH